jgi:hypothetical protein
MIRENMFFGERKNFVDIVRIGCKGGFFCYDSGKIAYSVYNTEEVVFSLYVREIVSYPDSLPCNVCTK